MNETIKELSDYLESYQDSYYGKDIQPIHLIESSGHAEGFYIGNIIKYASRYGKKNGYNKDDIFKILHYSILLLNHHSNINNNDEMKG